MEDFILDIIIVQKTAKCYIPRNSFCAAFSSPPTTDETGYDSIVYYIDTSMVEQPRAYTLTFPQQTGCYLTVQPASVEMIQVLYFAGNCWHSLPN